jgi:hypothetical protein
VSLPCSGDRVFIAGTSGCRREHYWRSRRYL